MPMYREMRQAGDRLFRWRSFFPLALLAVFLVAMRDFRYLGNSQLLDEVWEVVCFAVSFFGLGIRVHTVGHTPRRTSGRNTKHQVAESLNTTGMYSVLRNPLYLGNFFMWLGVAMFPHNVWLVAVYVLAFWLYYERIIIAEEAFLEAKFGHSYLNWAAVTPAFIPNFRRYEQPELPFSLRNVLRREYNGFLGVILAMLLFEVIGDLVVRGRVDLEWGWYVIVAVGGVTWVTLRFLKRHSSLLDVTGRV